MAQTRADIERAIHALELELSDTTDKQRRAELNERINYLLRLNVDVAAREYAEDVKDDYRFRQW